MGNVGDHHSSDDDDEGYDAPPTDNNPNRYQEPGPDTEECDDPPPTTDTNDHGDESYADTDTRNLDGNILDEANETVGQRAEEYGPPTENFRAIADMWSGYLGVEITPYDYAQMMILAKIGRTKTGDPTRDTHVDEAGYGLCADLVWDDGEQPGPYYGGEDGD